MKAEDEFHRPLSELTLIVSNFIWVGDQQAYLTSFEWNASQIRELYRRTTNMGNLDSLFGTSHTQPHLKLSMPQATTYIYRFDQHQDQEIDPTDKFDPRVARAEASKLMDDWLKSLDGSMDSHSIRVPSPHLFAALEETRDEEDISLRVHEKGVDVHTLNTVTSVAHFTPARLLRLLCYLVEDEHVDKLIGRLLQEDPAEALDLFERGYPIFGLPEDHQRSAPTPTPDQAQQLLSQNNQKLRTRALRLLRNMEGLKTQLYRDLSAPTGRGRQ